MSDWQRVIDKVEKQRRTWERRGCDIVFYRGHRLGSWTLKCGLGRGTRTPTRTQVEAAVYYDFVSLAGPLLPYSANSWDVAFAMQHHGLPTRLLDWTTSFSTALYFAIQTYIQKGIGRAGSRCIWMLNPFELNEGADEVAGIANPLLDLSSDYHGFFIAGSKTFQPKVLAINPSRSSPRQAAQKSAFTLHGDIWTPLEALASKCLCRIDIPRSALSNASKFLGLAGVTEYTLFPDLDGLARQIRRELASHF